MNRLPLGLRQQTFVECRNVGAALLDAPTLSNWVAVRGEIAAAHQLPGQPIQVKLRPDLQLSFWRGQRLKSSDDLLALLRSLSPDAGLLLSIVVGAVREIEHVRVTPAELVRALRWGSRSAEDARSNESEVFGLLMIFDALRLHGQRRGKWEDERTHDSISTKLDGQPLIHVAPSEVPGSLVITAGAWLAENRRNGRLLADFGQIESLTTICAKQKSGVMARRLGMALHQLWRERADGAKRDKSGAFSIGKPLTRMELLARAHLLEDFTSILKGHDPSRALKLWGQMLAHLRGVDILAKTQISVAVPLRRQGWRDYWLFGEEALKPSESLQRSLLEIAERAKASRRRHFAQKGGRRRAA